MKIETNNLVKNFKDEVALNSLSIKLEGNKIVGLLGKNGAGKTTLMRLLAGHFLPSSGEIKINDQNPFDHYDITKNICLIQENYNFDENFRVQDILKISSTFYPNWSHEDEQSLLAIFKLKKKRKVSSLSKGMLSALSIIVGLASNAPITMFDEPYIGLDASNRATFYELLLESYQDNPRLIILSTHLIDEVSQLFEEVIILHDGQLKLHEQADELSMKHYLISGSKQVVDEAIRGKEVLHQSELLGKKTVVLFDEKVIKQPGLSISQVSLQELFIYLTKEEANKIENSN